MRPLFSPETRRRLQENDPKWHVKAILQLVCTVLAFNALILFADATAITNRYYGTAYHDWSDWMPLFPVLISLIYNPVTFFLLLRGLGKPIHPGWHVGFHFLIWALGIPSIVFSVGYGWFWWWQPVLYRYRSGRIPCRGYNFWSEPCQPAIYTIGRIEIAANVFLGLLIIFEFALFFMACIAARKHRLAVRQSRMPARLSQLQYNRDPEAHAAQEPPAYTPSEEHASSGTPPAAAVKYS
ncbi:MAG: hypothetical protein LQ339_006541 [Xanthoria mediterranea]|nr:MAG: hypothetical protein LQ339_006541 [Xanthoria mediterranea]